MNVAFTHIVFIVQPKIKSKTLLMVEVVRSILFSAGLKTRGFVLELDIILRNNTTQSSSTATQTCKDCLYRVYLPLLYC